MAEQEIDLNGTLRGLFDVAKVALGADGPKVSDEEAIEIIIRLLAVIERTMPPDLQDQDVRVVRARMALDALRH